MMCSVDRGDHVHANDGRWQRHQTKMFLQNTWRTSLHLSYSTTRIILTQFMIFHCVDHFEMQKNGYCQLKFF